MIPSLTVAEPAHPQSEVTVVVVTTPQSPDGAGAQAGAGAGVLQLAAAPEHLVARFD